MAVAWIAWRDYTLVMEQIADYRKQAIRWKCQEWNEPVQEGRQSCNREGWSLTCLAPSTAVRLGMLEKELFASGGLPATAQLTPAAAEEDLWRKLSEGLLRADGFDRNGALIEIPVREWSRLKLFEERNQDAVKYSAMDQYQPYSQVTFLREDLTQIWPRYEPFDTSTPLHSESFQPLDPHRPGWMPFSEGAYWIACEGGSKSIHVQDIEVWKESVSRLLAHISAGKIAVTGRRRGQGLSVPIEATSFVGIRIDYPYSQTPIELLVGSTPHLSCYGVAADEELWETNFHDALIGQHRQVPEYSHLQVCNADLAREFAFGKSIRTVTLKSKAESSLATQVRAIVLRLWPDGGFAGRKKDRDKLIRAEFTEHPPSERTIRRALEEKN
jgi:hypothetical protein